MRVFNEVCIDKITTKWIASFDQHRLYWGLVLQPLELTANYIYTMKIYEEYTFFLYLFIWQ